MFWAPLAAAQVDARAIAPGGVIESGLVPPNVGGCWNQPSLTVTLPAGRIFALYTQSVNAQGQSIMAGISVAYASSSHTFPVNATTYVFAGLFGDIAYAASNVAPDAYHSLLYVVATQQCAPDNHGAIAYIQGRLQLQGGGYPMWEGAENPIACSSLGGPLLAQQSACLNGNWLILTSNDPTTFAAEGLGGSAALEVNPQMGCVRFVPGRVPQPNDYICQIATGFGAGTENPNAVTVQYGSIIGRVVDPRPASRAGRVDISTVDATNNGGTGTLPRLSMIKGVFCADEHGDVPGGDMGPNSINCGSYYVNGVRLADYVRSQVSQALADERAVERRANTAEMPRPKLPPAAAWLPAPLP